MVRNSLSYAPWQEIKKVAADLREIYTASTADEGLLCLDRFKRKWDDKFPVIAIQGNFSLNHLPVFWDHVTHKALFFIIKKYIIALFFVLLKL